MTDERKPVICPCGKEMQLCTAEGIMPAYRYIVNYHCECGWNSPVRDGTTESEAVDAAYHAATCRPPIDENTSDGYHTFKELYHHRAILFAALIAQMPEKAWKSKTHSDGTVWDGWFIVGIETPEGMATYHYAVEPYWDMFCCQECERAPEWDGHTPEQAINRIALLTATPPNLPLTLPELFDLEDDDAAWVVAENGKIYAMGAECAQEWASEEHCLFFARKPTPEDIEAARVDGVANP